MGSQEKLSEEELGKLGIIHPGTPDQSLLSCYRDIRNQLLELSDYQNFVCLVSALSPHDETSLMSLNLAAVFAFDKSRSALVVDCCSEANILNSLITEDEAMGLIDFIEMDYDDMGALLFPSGIDRVRVIPAGRVTETRTETLDSSRMREIIIELKHRYPDRFVFVNAPNMSMYSEVKVLSNICDMVVFEISPGTVSPKQVTDAIEMIGPEKVAGVLFKDN